MRRREFDLVVVGLGSAGLTAARLAASIGLRVAAVERAKVGGDCLWTGCVPSKTLLASARVARAVRTADRFGLVPGDPGSDLTGVWRRIHEVQDGIEADKDNPERLESEGVEVVSGEARLDGPRAVEVAGRVLTTRYVLLCTGSRPAVPPVPGLVGAAFLTTESLWQLDRPLGSLLVLGGGAVGVELAQAFVRLGVAVKLVERESRILPLEPPELTRRLERALREEGVEFVLGAAAERADASAGGKSLTVAGRMLQADEILVAAGRAPNVEGLGLEAAGVRTGPRGIEVDRHLRTSSRRVYAAGDVAGRYRFTHSAAYEAATAVRNMFFPGWSNAPELVPSCTYTEPELACVGLTQEQAAERHGARRVRVLRADLGDSDRGRADGAGGEILLVTVRGRLAGAQVLAPSGGEILHELLEPVARRRRVERLARNVHLYPTYGTAVNELAAEAVLERARRLAWLARVGR